MATTFNTRKNKWFLQNTKQICKLNTWKQKLYRSVNIKYSVRGRVSTTATEPRLITMWRFSVAQSHRKINIRAIWQALQHTVYRSYNKSARYFDRTVFNKIIFQLFKIANTLTHALIVIALCLIFNYM